MIYINGVGFSAFRCVEYSLLILVVNKQVQFDICNGVKYSFLMYNCQHFARLVVSIISRDSEVGYKQNPGAKAGPLAVEAFGSRILTTEDADIFFGEEKAYMSISEAYGHYKCN